jgi:membrane protein involved in colicin uptake
MNSKINSIVISSILAFALIAGIIPATFAQNNTGMASEGGNMTGMTQDGNITQGQGGNMTGMSQGQTSEDDGDDGDDGDKDDGDSEEDKDKGE